MPLLTIILKKDLTGKEQVNLFGSISKQPIIMTSYFLKCQTQQPYLFLKLPFLNNFDCNTNSLISGTIPIFTKNSLTDKSVNKPVITNINQTTGAVSYTTQVEVIESSDSTDTIYKEVNYEFNIARNIPESFIDYELYASDGNPIDIYTLILTFTYRRPELI